MLVYPCNTNPCCSRVTCFYEQFMGNMLPVVVLLNPFFSRLSSPTIQTFVKFTFIVLILPSFTTGNPETLSTGLADRPPCDSSTSGTSSFWITFASISGCMLEGRIWSKWSQGVLISKVMHGDFLRISKSLDLSFLLLCNRTFNCLPDSLGQIMLPFCPKPAYGLPTWFGFLFSWVPTSRP